MYGANVRSEAGRIGILGNWNRNADIVGGAAAFELCFCLDEGLSREPEMRNEDRPTYLEHVFNSAAGMTFHDALNPN